MLKTVGIFKAHYLWEDHVTLEGPRDFKNFTR